MKCVLAAPAVLLFVLNTARHYIACPKIYIIDIACVDYVSLFIFAEQLHNVKDVLKAFAIGARLGPE